ncbi:TIGR00725 family protein [Chachezhania antarctica]|uniref:TIGR00725 family protein n=1 Tax=Chachezhania antarctica TaxID=2340860 RepID=UPI000EAC07DF|nr:TIGR00725 family protein [Chachezhania antarctica]
MQEVLSRTEDGRLFLGANMLCGTAWAWRADGGAPDSVPVTALEALRALSRTRPLQQLVIGIIGPRDATPAQRAAAEAVGHALGGLGLTVICGGRSGVMEAACKGCSDAGGLPIGILPGTDPMEANPYVAVPLTTGLNEARNIIIVRAARVLLAVGNSPGTLTEVAYGLHFGKPVIGVAGAAELDGVHHAEGAASAVETALTHLLASLPMVEAD